MIFTVCTGRCGQHSLAEYFNRFGKNCFAEVEPPNLFYKNYWPLGGYARLIQRKWIVTNEKLGRGKALIWHDNNEFDKLEALAGKRIDRVEKIIKKKNASHYIEVSKFFIRSYCDAMYKLRKDIGLLKLYRNPLKNARSFINRNKNFSLDGLMPYFKKTCFKIDLDKLTKYQLYLWQWVEIDLRYQRLIEENNIAKHYEFKTEDLSDTKEIEKLFQFFNIDYQKPIERITPKNTNISQGKIETLVSRQDVDEFYQFLDMIPPYILNKISVIEKYCP